MVSASSGSSHRKGLERLSVSWREDFRYFLGEPYHTLILPLIVYLLANPQSLNQIVATSTGSSSSPFLGPIAPITAGAILATSSILLILGLRKFGFLVSAFYAISTCISALGVYELVLEVFFPNAAYSFKLEMFLFAVVGLVSIRSWKLKRRTVLIFALWFGMFVAWALEDPTLPQSSNDLFPFAMNSLTKVFAFLVCALPYLDGLAVPERDPSDEK